MKTKCQCNKCYEYFKIKVHELEYIEEDKVSIEGFECPHCNQRYITTVFDNNLRKSIFEAKQVHDEIIELNRKKDKEYAAYMEDLGTVPMKVIEQYVTKLTALQRRYELIKKYNLKLGQELKDKYCKK